MYAAVIFEGCTVFFCLHPLPIFVVCMFKTNIECFNKIVVRWMSYAVQFTTVSIRAIWKHPQLTILLQYGLNSHTSDFILWGRSYVYAILQTAFHTHFPVWKLLYFNSNFIAIDNYYWFTSIVAVNGLAPNRRQVIICINDGIIYLRIYASPVLGRLSTSSYTI